MQREKLIRKNYTIAAEIASKIEDQYGSDSVGDMNEYPLAVACVFVLTRIVAHNVKGDMEYAEVVCDRLSAWMKQIIKQSHDRRQSA